MQKYSHIIELWGYFLKKFFILFLKEIYGKYGRRNLTDNEIKKYKMTEREIFEKYNNLSENEPNSKNNNKKIIRNDVMTFVIKCCRGEKKRDERKIDEFRKKLKIPESEISQCEEHIVKSKI